MKKFYELKIAGLVRNLPVCKLNEELCIAGFVILGDSELTVNCAREMIKVMPDYDIMITAEAKGIPLAHEMCRQNGRGEYIVARKAVKLYMPNPVSVEVSSITTVGSQTLVLDQKDADAICGRRVLIVDDVVSTGNSLNALERLVELSGGKVCGKMAILAEGAAAKRKDIIFLEELPMLDNQGNPI